MRSTRLNPFIGPSLMEDAHMGLSRELSGKGFFHSSLISVVGWKNLFHSFSSCLQLLLLVFVKLQFKIAIPIEHQLGKLGVDFVSFCFHYSIEAGSLYLRDEQSKV